MTKSPKNSLTLEDAKDIVIDSIIFVSPFVVSNIDTIQRIISSYVSTPEIVPFIVAFILYVSKRFAQGPSNTTVND